MKRAELAFACAITAGMRDLVARWNWGDPLPPELDALVSRRAAAAGVVRMRDMMQALDRLQAWEPGL